MFYLVPVVIGCFVRLHGVCTAQLRSEVRLEVARPGGVQHTSSANSLVPLAQLSCEQFCISLHAREVVGLLVPRETSLGLPISVTSDPGLWKSRAERDL